MELAIMIVCACIFTFLVLFSRSLWLRQGLAVACCRVPGIGHFEGDLHDLHYLHHSLASGQTIGREHSPIHQQKIRLKIY